MTRACKVKICGMRDRENIREVAKLEPDYLGFIFVPASPRFVGLLLEPATVLELPDSIERVGVFRNAEISYVIDTVERYDLDIIQLHGDEQPQYCEELGKRLPHIRLVKAFAVDELTSFENLNSYASKVSFFLLDGKDPGSGVPWSLELLSRYRGSTPLMIAGGVDEARAAAVVELVKNGLPIIGIDVNSRAESEPGIKRLEVIRSILEKVT